MSWRSGTHIAAARLAASSALPAAAVETSGPPRRAEVRERTVPQRVRLRFLLARFRGEMTRQIEAIREGRRGRR